MANPANNRREFTRYDTDVSAAVTSPSMRISVRMLSVSAGGAFIRLDRLSSKVFDADTFLLEIYGIGRFSVSRKWRRDTDFGVKFDLGAEDQARLARRLEERFGQTAPQMARMAANSAQP
jgi:hypothetical protein